MTRGVQQPGQGFHQIRLPLPVGPIIRMLDFSMVTSSSARGCQLPSIKKRAIDC